jgi:hypothetical protein
MPKPVFKIRPLDLHQKKYADVTQLVEDYVLMNQFHAPLQIITGNSEPMKALVIKSLKAMGFKYEIGDRINTGYIIVRK